MISHIPCDLRNFVIQVVVAVVVVVVMVALQIVAEEETLRSHQVLCSLATCHLMPPRIL